MIQPALLSYSPEESDCVPVLLEAENMKSDRNMLGNDFDNKLKLIQKEMENTASKDRMILSEARERAKLIIERNIKAAGEAQGIQYTVKFIDAE